MEDTLAISKSNLLMSALVGSSCLLISACGGSDTKEQSSTVSEKAAEVADDTAETVSNAADAAEEAATDAADTMTDAADAMEDSADKAMDEVAGAASDTMDKAADTMADMADGAAGKVANAANETVAGATAAVTTAVADASETVEAVAASADSEAASAYAALTGDAAKGKTVFYKCLSCHSVKEGENKLGPSLYGIVGRQAGSIEGFNYSDANKNSGITWTEDVMFAYLENPQAYIPGTRMIFPGLPAEQDRADVIAYLKSVPE